MTVEFAGLDPSGRLWVVVIIQDDHSADVVEGVSLDGLALSRRVS